MNDDDLPIEITTQTGPWAMVPAWVLHMGLTGNELAAYVAIRTFADRSGAAHPSIATLAERAGISRSTVNRALVRLRDLSLVHTTQRRRSTNGSIIGLTYRMRDIPPLSATVTRPPECHRDTTPVSPADTTPVSPADTQNTPMNTPGNTEDLLLTADAASAAASRSALAAEFDTWWPHYPRRVGKKEAQKAYVKARREVSAERLLQAVTAYSADPNQPLDRTKIPHAATWLNGGRWDDEPLPAPISTATQRVAAAASLIGWAESLDAADERRALARRQQRQPLAIGGGR